MLGVILGVFCDASWKVVYCEVAMCTNFLDQVRSTRNNHSKVMLELLYFYLSRRSPLIWAGTWNVLVHLIHLFPPLAHDANCPDNEITQQSLLPCSLRSHELKYGLATFVRLPSYTVPFSGPVPRRGGDSRNVTSDTSALETTLEYPFCGAGGHLNRDFLNILPHLPHC